MADADTVFGTVYAQAEDDFNRVETLPASFNVGRIVFLVQRATV